MRAYKWICDIYEGKRQDLGNTGPTTMNACPFGGKMEMEDWKEAFHFSTVFKVSGRLISYYWKKRMGLW